MAPILTTDRIIADPFGERGPVTHQARMRLLGANFRFDADSGELLKLLKITFGDLPCHRLTAATTNINLRLVSSATGRKRRRATVPAPRFAAGGGLLCSTIDASNYVALSPDNRSGLVALSRELLKAPYCASRELLEFAVCTLASRVQGLVPLHAACVARQHRGLLLMGESGAGKTTVAAQCLVNGFDFLSEDSSFVNSATGLATGLANYIYLRPSTLKFLPPDRAALLKRGSIAIRRRSGVAKLQVNLRRLNFRLATSACRVAAVVLLSARPAGKGPLLRPLRIRDALARIERLQPYAASQPGWDRFAALVAGLQSWELRRDVHPRAALDPLRALTSATPHE